MGAERVAHDPLERPAVVADERDLADGREMEVERLQRVAERVGWRVTSPWTSRSAPTAWSS